MRRKVLVGSVVIFVAMIAAAWFIQPVPLRERIRRAGFTFAHEEGNVYKVKEIDVPRLRQWLYDNGFTTKLDGTEFDFGRTFLHERRILFFYRYVDQNVWFDPELTVHHMKYIEINPDK